MLVLLFFFSSVYAILILTFFIGIFCVRKVSDFQEKKISVIVAARNEEEHLPHLLKTLTEQNYPNHKYEVIVCDDRSSDETFQIALDFQTKNSNFQVVKITKESPKLVGKKGAITKAIQKAKYDLLAFIDADCIPKKDWLKSINEHFDDETDFVAGYTFLKLRNSFYSLMKNLERSAFYGVIAASVGLNWKVSCTAGNMAYRKKIFEKVNGFEGIGHIRSGDDDLMLQKMSKHIKKIKFMFKPKSAVITQGNDDLTSQIHQETRRGSKWKYYSNSVKLLTLVVFISYLFFVLALGLLFFKELSLFHFTMITLIKVIPEFLLVFTFLIKIKKLKLILAFPVAELIYIPYFIFFGIKGSLGKYKWKN